MREKEGFREQYAILKERFPGREAISLDETCAVLGISRYVAGKLIKSGAIRAKQPSGIAKGTYIISLAALARYLC